MKPVVNFAMLDGKEQGLTYLTYLTGEVKTMNHWPEGYKKGEPVEVEYPVQTNGRPNVHNQKVQRELETELLKRMDAMLTELRSDFEDRFEEDDGTCEEWCPDEDMPDWPGSNYYHLYYT